MEKRVISAVLSEQAVSFRPGGPPATFEVVVTNEGPVPAQFQLEILAAGASRNLQWYRLDPEVSAVKPPGGQTKFTVAVIDSPLVGFVGTINVTVRIFSPQLKEERKYLLRLNIGMGDGRGQLLVDLPVRQFQVLPCNVVDIPVRVRNVSQQPVDVVLRFLNLPASWLVGGTERRFVVEAGGQTDALFQCQPPVANQAPSQEYPFAVEAVPQVGAPGRAEGSLEVLPVGFVAFACTAPQQRLPAEGGVLWPDFSDGWAQFPLLFKNASNLRQQVGVQVQGRDQPKLTLSLSPSEAELPLAGSCNLNLNATRKRPLLGPGERLTFEAAAVLADQRLGNADPAQQSLELKLLPKIPLWMQLLLLLLLALLVWLLLNLPKSEDGHTGVVNAVRISGDARTVLSASDDRSIRRWSVDGNRLKPDGKLVADAGDAVRALRFAPQNDLVAAGLGNGPIQLWDVATGTRERQLLYKAGDRVGDLVFSLDARRLFSGHGSGRVIEWNLDASADDRPAHVFELDRRFLFAIRGLVLTPDERRLVAVGQYNRVILWDLQHPDDRPLRLSMEKANASGGQNDYIKAVAVAPRATNLLVTADSQGFITLWDLSRCTTVGSVTDPVDGVPPALNVPLDVDCPVLDRWAAHRDFSVNTVFLSRDGKQLLSGGNDHRTLLWYLDGQGRRRSKTEPAQVLDERPNNINAVEAGRDSEGFFEVSGDDDYKVTMQRAGTR